MCEMARLPTSERLWRSIVTIGVNLRKIVSGAVLALTMAIAVVTVPNGASAKSTAGESGVSVCNTASQHWQGGDLVILDQDPQMPINNASGMRAMPHGNVNAAMHSPALAVCGTDPGNSGVNS
jgi:hypothetical protein